MKLKISIFICCLISTLSADAGVGPEFTVYKKLSSLTNPTESDWEMLQFYLSHGKRPNIALLKDYEIRARNFRLFGNTEDEKTTGGCGICQL